MEENEVVHIEAITEPTHEEIESMGNIYGTELDIKEEGAVDIAEGEGL